MDTASPDPHAPADDRFRLALAGAGRMGRAHLDAIQDSGSVVIAGVVEPQHQTRSVLREAGVPAFARLDQLLAATDVDGALIAVPTDRHLELLRQVMAAGIPALCEKPCGLSAEEAAQCASVAADAGLVLQVAYWRRFVPDLVLLRERILSGELGEILAVNCYQWDMAPPPAAFRESSGGMFVDMGVHEFDQIRWLTGQEFATVQVAGSRLGASQATPIARSSWRTWTAGARPWSASAAGTRQATAARRKSSARAGRQRPGSCSQPTATRCSARHFDARPRTSPGWSGLEQAAAPRLPTRSPR